MGSISRILMWRSSVVCRMPFSILLDGEQVVERLPFYQLSVAIRLTLQDLRVVGQGIGIIIVDNTVSLTDEP